MLLYFVAGCFIIYIEIGKIAKLEWKAPCSELPGDVSRGFLRKNPWWESPLSAWVSRNAFPAPLEAQESCIYCSSSLVWLLSQRLCVSPAQVAWEIMEMQNVKERFRCSPASTRALGFATCKNIIKKKNMRKLPVFPRSGSVSKWIIKGWKGGGITSAAGRDGLLGWAAQEQPCF